MRRIFNPLRPPLPRRAWPLTVSVMTSPFSGRTGPFQGLPRTTRDIAPVLPAAFSRAKRFDLLLEVVDRLEPPVDGGESQVGDFVQLTQRPKDGQTHVVRAHLGVSGRPDRLLDALPQLGQRVFRHRAARTGPAHPGDGLFAGERLGD